VRISQRRIIAKTRLQNANLTLSAIKVSSIVIKVSSIAIKASSIVVKVSSISIRVLSITITAFSQSSTSVVSTAKSIEIILQKSIIVIFFSIQQSINFLSNLRQSNRLRLQ